MVKRVRYYIGTSDKTGKPLNELEIRELTHIINKYFIGFTVYDARGYWNGISENTKIVEIILVDYLEDNIKKLETELKEWLKETNQECILKIIDTIETQLLEA